MKPTLLTYLFFLTLSVLSCPSCSTVKMTINPDEYDKIMLTSYIKIVSNEYRDCLKENNIKMNSLVNFILEVNIEKNNCYIKYLNFENKSIPQNLHQECILRGESEGMKSVNDDIAYHSNYFNNLRQELYTARGTLNHKLTYSVISNKSKLSWEYKE